MSKTYEIFKAYANKEITGALFNQLKGDLTPIKFLNEECTHYNLTYSPGKTYVPLDGYEKEGRDHGIHFLMKEDVAILGSAIPSRVAHVCDIKINDNARILVNHVVRDELWFKTSEITLVNERRVFIDKWLSEPELKKAIAHSRLFLTKMAECFVDEELFTRLSHWSLAIGGVPRAQYPMEYAMINEYIFLHGEYMISLQDMNMYMHMTTPITEEHMLRAFCADTPCLLRFVDTKRRPPSIDLLMDVMHYMCLQPKACLSITRFHMLEELARRGSCGMNYDMFIRKIAHLVFTYCPAFGADDPNRLGAFEWVKRMERSYAAVKDELEPVKTFKDLVEWGSYITGKYPKFFDAMKKTTQYLHDINHPKAATAINYIKKVEPDFDVVSEVRDQPRYNLRKRKRV